MTISNTEIQLFEELMLANRALLQVVPPKQVLFCNGDRCEHFVMIRNGRIRVELLSSSGQQLLLYRIATGQACVMTTACLVGGSNYSAQAITETNTEVLLLPQNEFQSLLASSRRFRDFVFDGFSDRFAAMMERTTELATHTIDQRLASALMARCDLQRTDTIDITHDQLAVEIGTVREVVSRRLAIFEKQGLIARQRRHILVLDKQNLTSRLAHES